MAAPSPITIAATVSDLWDKAVDALKEKDKQNVDFQRTDKLAILADVLGEVQRKKQTCIDHRLKYKRSNGESVHLYDVFEKIVKWVNKFKEVGDAAAQYDPGHAALPWAAIRFVLQVSVNDIQTFGSLVEGLEIVCKIVARYSAIEKLYLRQPSSVNNMLEDSIVATYASILRFLSKCRKYFDLGLTRRVARSITQLPETSVSKHLDRIAKNDKRVSELTNVVDAERSQLTYTGQLSVRDGIEHLVDGLGGLRMESTSSASKLEALLTDFKEPIIRTMNQVSTFSESLIETRNEYQLKEERLAILQWLSNVQYKKHHHTLSKGLLEGTGSWLLNKDQFVEWRESSVSSVLWLHGIPGSGKTCLVAKVIQQLLTETSTCQNAAPVVYFYCHRNTAEPQRSDPAEVLRAILKQLLCHQALWLTESSTAKEYRRRKCEADKDGSEIERLDISETIRNIVDAVARMPVTILIDALDECRADERHQLLRALELLLENSAQLVKVFVSSRDDVDIVLKLQKHPNIYISIHDNKHDIDRFIQVEVEKAQSDGRLLKGIVSPELKALITENLERKARGMFLWVSLQIESLCDSRRIKIEGDLVDELSRLPQTLAGMYSLILENISQIEQRGRTVAETIFRWLLCTNDARSHVTIAACSGPTSTQYRSLSISDILDVCSNLVVYDEYSDRFRFAHLSVREFLESQPGYTSSETNRFVMERSLQKLSHNQPSKDPFRSYATLNWILHYGRIGGIKEQDRKGVFVLYANRFLFNSPESISPNLLWNTVKKRALLLTRNDFYDVLEDKRYEITPETTSQDFLDVMSTDRGTATIPSHTLNLLFNRFLYWVLPRTEDDMYTLEEKFESPINLASRFGWLEILEHFEMNKSPDNFHGPAEQMMTIAIQFGQIPVVRWLLDRSIHPTDEHLQLAFHKQKSEIIQLFLDVKALCPNTLVNGQDILVLAVRFGLGDIYQDLVKKGANIHGRDQNGRTLLSHAVSNPSFNSEIIEDLLLTGMDPIEQDEYGGTPLALSLWGEHPPGSYSMLTDRMYKPSTRIKPSTIIYREDLLRRVSESSDYHIACLLLHFGLDGMLGDADMRAEWTEVLTLIGTLPSLLNNTSASVTKQSRELANNPEDHTQLAGQTLLSLAALFRHEKAFRVLLDWGIDPTCPAICEVRKKTSTFAQIGHSTSTQRPLNQKRQSDYRTMSDELRQAPLAWAAITGNLSLVRSILDRGLDPNIRNRKGQTALFFAVQETEDRDLGRDLEAGKEAVVRLLLRHGAAINLSDADRRSILAHAFKARYARLARILLENGAEPPANDMDGLMEWWRGTFDHGQEGIRGALLARTGGARLNLLNVQSSSRGLRGSGDPLDVAARLIHGGAMRFLGDAAPTASGDGNSST